MPVALPGAGAASIPTNLAARPSLSGAVPGLTQARQPQSLTSGLEAHAHTMMAGILQQLQSVLAMTPTGTPMHHDVMHALAALSKHAPEGVSTAELSIRQLQQAQQNVARNAAMQNAVRAQAQGAPPVAAPTRGF